MKVIELSTLKIFVIIFVFLGIGIYEAPELIKRKLYRELYTFSFLMLLGFVLIVSYILGLRLHPL